MAYWQIKDIPPRQLGPYLERRSAGHRALISDAGQAVARFLVHQDRGRAWETSGPELPPMPALPQATRVVSDLEGLRQALALAQPGEVIELAPGAYVVERAALAAIRPGEPSRPITVQARDRDATTVAVRSAEGFAIMAPYWVLQNLRIVGACAVPGHCEHAVHVSGKGSHFIARHNVISDFNAHVKINGQGGDFPDYGQLLDNMLINTAPRATASPVTPVDLVAASGWLVRGNQIADFIKAGGDRISYGAFAKGAGERNIFSGNRIVCEDKLPGYPGQRVGLSLGGGGTGPRYCRDGRCIVEQHSSILRDNLIASCSDDGIYLNGAAASQLSANTLIDTGGITVRHAHSSAELSGNIVDGLIRSRDGGVIRDSGNESTAALWLYLGRHPVRDAYRENASRASAR